MATYWWERLPQRVLEEDAQLRALIEGGTITRYAWRRQADGQLWLTAELYLAGDTQMVELRFPERYPGECPIMRPIPYGTRLSKHQFGGDGVLCLELGPDNWHSRYTAVNLLESAWKLLALETINTIKSIPIPSRHVDTLGMEVRRNFLRVIASQTALNCLNASDPVVEFQYATVSEEDALVFWVTDVPSNIPLEGIPPIIAARNKLNGLSVRLADAAELPPTNLAAFRTYLEQAGVPTEMSEAASGLVLFLQTFRIIARFIFDSDVSEVSVIADRRTEEPERRPAAIAASAEAARVAIVGLGSLGSKVAVSLARSGVKNFVLVDGDVFLPENVSRHDADYSLASLMKVKAASARLRRVAATPLTIATFDHDIADGSNPAIHAKTVTALASADLIIDSTADPDAFNFLADLASEERRCFAWGEVFAGGLGGYVAYATPQETPCPSCVRAAFHANAAEWLPAPVGAPEPYAAARANGLPIIATDADVTVIAGALTALSLRLLSGDLAGQAPLTFIGLQRGWIFDHVFDTRIVHVRRDDFSCPRCWNQPTKPDATLLTEVEKLLAEQRNVDDQNQS